MRWLEENRLEFIVIFPRNTEIGFDWHWKIGSKNWRTPYSFDKNLFIYRKGMTVTFKSDKGWL